MTPERWKRIEELYHAVATRAVAERTAWLETSCAGDLSLRQDVEALLDLDERAAQFLEGSALEEAAKSIADDRGLSFTARQIGGYQLLSFLGAGGAGEVYRARDIKLDREVALKIFTRTAAGGPDDLRRFDEEARLASGLNHPNIVTIYGVGDEGDVVYIAMELVHGRTLRECLASDSIGVRKTLDLAVQVADALAAAHAMGIVHLDLKPENVMVKADGLVKILDFGLARRQNALSETSLTGDGIIRGTVGYMSPEQAAGGAPGHTADQFSFGVILFELLYGARAFERNTPGETLSAIVHEPPGLRGDPLRDVPKALQAILDRCLTKDPSERYQNTGELAATLRQIRDEWDRPTPVMTRRRAIWLGGGAALSAGAGVVAWQFWPRSSQIRSLAVLPFLNALNDEDVEYLCDGITESLIQGISRLPSLRVMARSTVFNFKGKPVDPRDAGRQLAVDAVLTGTVARQSDRITIGAELVEVSTGARLWSHTYDRSATDVLAVQDEIARAIVNDGVRLRLSGDEQGALVRHPTDDPEAYELYLRAVHQHRKQAERGYLSARELLQQAIARDPKFALAYAALAATYTVMAVDGYERPTTVRSEVSRNVRLALALDPDLPAARGEAASEAFFFNWDWASAEREWKVALRPRVGDIEPDSMLGYSLERWALGYPNEALQLARRARELDFLSPTFAVREADFLYQTNQLDAAATLYEKVIHDEPEDPRAYFGLAEVHAAQMRFGEAIDARRRGHAAAGDNSLEALFVTARGEAGYREIENSSARLQLDALRDRAAAGGYVSPLDYARAYAQLDDKDRAFSHFDDAFADRAPGLVFLKVDRSWDQLRNDPRFVAAVERVGLP